MAFPGKHWRENTKGSHKSATLMRESRKNHVLMLRLKVKKRFLRHSVDFNRIETTLLNLMGEPIEAQVITESPRNTSPLLSRRCQPPPPPVLLVYSKQTLPLQHHLHCSSFFQNRKQNQHTCKKVREEAKNSHLYPQHPHCKDCLILWPLDFSQVVLKTM